MPEHTLTTRDLLRKYDKSTVTIYNWIAAGLPHKKGKDGMKEIYLFNEAEVDAWLNKDKVEG